MTAIQPIKFACDALPDCQGQIVESIGNFVIIEGLAQDSGAWFAKGVGGARRFQTRQEAADYIEYAMDAEDPKAEREMRDRMNGITRNAEGKIIAIRGRKLIPQTKFRPDRDVKDVPGA